MSTIKFTLWIIWIGVLISIGALILLPLAILMVLFVPILLVGILIA